MGVEHTCPPCCTIVNTGRDGGGRDPARDVASVRDELLPLGNVGVITSELQDRREGSQDRLRVRRGDGQDSLRERRGIVLLADLNLDAVFFLKALDGLARLSYNHTRGNVGHEHLELAQACLELFVSEGISRSQLQ